MSSNESRGSRQLPLDQNEKDKESRHFGDELSKRKRKDTVRIMFQNIRGLGSKEDSSKAETLRQNIADKQIDIIGMVEVNVNWKRVAKRKNLTQMSKQWFESSKVSVSYNYHQISNKTKFQPGGAAIISRGSLALRAIDFKPDSRRMGRWSSQLFKGKEGIATRMVTMYVPKPTDKHTFQRVFSQQQSALVKLGITGSVLKIYWQDFWQQVDEWLDNGEQLIIAGDFNEDIRKEEVLKEFRKRQLVPATYEKHGPNLPATHNTGKDPIDEIFVSSTLQVEKCGYLEHGQLVGDHRPVWVEITKNSMLGSKLPPLTTFSARRLKCNDPRLVTRYNKKLDELFNENGIYNRASKLLKKFCVPLSQAQQEEYEKIDKIRCSCMLKAEKYCRKLRMGKVDWSPQIQKARDTIKYFTLTLRRKKGRHVGARTLIKLSNKTSCVSEHLTERQLNDKIDKAYKDYKKLKKQHKKLRASHLELLAEALEKQGKGKKATIIKGLIQLENQRQMFRKIAMVNKKNESMCTTYITIKDDEGMVKELNNKEDMENAIMNENRQKYHQTEKTCPFMRDPLKNHFGEVGTGPAIDMVLDGGYYMPQGLTEQTEEYIRQCKIPEVENIKTNLRRPLEKYRKSWEKIKEKTASRELHFGHFKAAMKNDYITSLHYIMAEVPFRSGYSPKRWQKCTNIMLLKKQGEHNVTKLRTICLYEADFNHNNKFFGREMIKHTQTHGLLHKEQYSLPGKKCSDHVLNRALLFDITRYKKTGLGMASVDLKSCYDRVAHAPSTLAMTGYGMPKEPIQSMYTTIQNMQYHTKTVHGVSKETFGGKEDFIACPNGLGQGNGAGPACWSVSSAHMFDVLKARGKSSKIITPLSNKSLDMCGFAVVDDTDLIAMTENNDAEETQYKLQQIIDDWEAVAKTTGGALAPQKSWCWNIQFEWNKSSWKYKNNVGNKDLEIVTVDKDNVRKVLPQLKCDEAKEMLGVWLSPDGNNKKQKEVLIEKMKKYGEYVRTGHVTKHEAWTALNMVYMKSVQYALPSLTLTEEDYKDITWPLLKHVLPKSGINRNINRDLLYGTIKSQGLGVYSPFLFQGVSHIVNFIDNNWKDNMTGHFFTTSMEQMRIELGLNINMLSSDYYQYNQTLKTKSIVRFMWQFMTDHNIRIEDTTKEIPLLREQDSSIMEDFRSNNLIKASDYNLLNECRIYLKVFSLADIVDGSGKKITIKAWNGIQFDHKWRNTKYWPKWGKPSGAAWTTWVKALKLTYCKGHDRVLKNPLGRWLQRIESSWWVDTNQDKTYLYQQSGHHYKKFPQVNISARNCRYNHSTFELRSELPETATPTTVNEIQNVSLLTEGTAKFAPVQSNIKPAHRTSWLQIQKNQEGLMSNIVRALERGDAIGVSDGSYSEHHGKGTASWIITNPDKSAYVSASSISPGVKEIQNSYRSEITGILSILEELKAICDTWGIKKGRCTIFCDGLSALQRVDEIEETILTSKHCCADLLQACKSIKNSIPISLVFVHVRGHQDDNKLYDELTLIEKLNVIMDRLAKDMLSEVIENEVTIYEQHKFSPLLPIVNNIPIHQDVFKSLYEAVADNRVHKRWIKHERFPQCKLQNINWTEQGKANKQLPRHKRHFISKWSSEWLATGARMVEWKLRYKDNCPYCGKPKEDTNHILHCAHDDVSKLWEEKISQLDKRLLKIKTCYRLRRAIIQELRYWRKCKSASNVVWYDDDLKAAIMEQRKIGWRNFLEGLISNKITQYQQEYYEYKEDKRKGSKWTRSVIKEGWNILHSVWLKRNEKLHEKDKIQEMEGLPVLEKVINKECAIGLSQLPMQEFSHFFRLKKEDMKKLSIDTKKDWLVTIKTARRLYDDINYKEDEFDTNEILSKWIDLEFRRR